MEAPANGQKFAGASALVRGVKACMACFPPFRRMAEAFLLLVSEYVERQTEAERENVAQTYVFVGDGRNEIQVGCAQFVVEGDAFVHVSFAHGDVVAETLAQKDVGAYFRGEAVV